MLCDLFDRPARDFPDKPAIVRDSATFNYRDLARAAAAMAWRLREARLGAGETVALQMPNGPEYAAALWAAWHLGICVLPLDPAFKPAEVAAYCAQAGAGTVLRPGGPIAAPMETLLESPHALPPPEPFAPDRPALLLLSSGTTGLPKLAVRSASRVESAAGLFRTAIPCGPDDRVLGVLPFFHSAGLFHVLLATLQRGATLYVEPFSPRQAAATIRRRRITVLVASPFMYRMLVATPFDEPPDLSSLRVAYSGTSAMTKAVLGGFQERFGVAMTQGYGTTETHAVAVTRPGRRVDPPSMVGRCYPGVDVTIRDDAGAPVGPGVEGTLWVRSPAAATAYLGDPQASDETFRHGAVVTGDIGLFDASGDLHILGRRRPLLSVGGRKVAPAEVEACLRGHAGVGDVAVFGEPGPDGYDRIRARVVPAGPVSVQELREFCAARLADYKLPRQIDLVDALAARGSGTWKQPAAGKEGL